MSKPGCFCEDVNKNREDQTSKLPSIEGIVPLLNNPDLLSEDEPYLAEECSEDEGCMGADGLKTLAWDRLLALRRAEATIRRQEKKLAKARSIIRQLQALGHRACKGVAIMHKRAQLANERRLGGVQTSGATQRELLDKIAALEAKLELAELHTGRKKGALCRICYQQAPDAVFRPCRHLIMCYKCYMENGPYDCPKCGTPIEQVYLLNDS